jgi:pimeloyl-ACP methyl ester carboxylesterase
MTLLFALTGCMVLDPVGLPAVPVDQYELAFEVVPAAQIEEVTFETADGLTLYGVWARQETPSDVPLVFFHGYSENIDAYTDRVDLYWQWGFDVFIFDYRGYGRSDGPATFDGVLEEDGLAAMEYVSATTGVEPSRIPWVTLSLGSAVALHTNDEVDAEIVVTEGALSSLDTLLEDESGLDIPAGWFFDDDFDNLEAIPNIQSPILLIHGAEDDFVDPWYSQMLYDLAPDPKDLWFPEGVGHADLHEVKPDEYRDRVLAFREEHG